MQILVVWNQKHSSILSQSVSERFVISNKIETYFECVELNSFSDYILQICLKYKKDFEMKWLSLTDNLEQIQYTMFSILVSHECKSLSLAFLILSYKCKYVSFSNTFQNVHIVDKDCNCLLGQSTDIIEIIENTR